MKYFNFFVVAKLQVLTWPQQKGDGTMVDSSNHAFPEQINPNLTK